MVEDQPVALKRSALDGDSWEGYGRADPEWGLGRQGEPEFVQQNRSSGSFRLGMLFPVFAHLALVLLLGLYIPPYLAAWYRQAAAMIG